jgi:hypothetical protein
MSTIDTPAPILSARELRHSFGQTEALRGIDLDVLPGEVLASPPCCTAWPEFSSRRAAA